MLSQFRRQLSANDFAGRCVALRSRHLPLQPSITPCELDDSNAAPARHSMAGYILSAGDAERAENIANP
jgi:hypothetical protein